MTLEGAVVADLQRQITALRLKLDLDEARMHRLETAVEALHDYVTPRSVSPC